MRFLVGLALLALVFFVPASPASTGNCDSKGTPALGVVTFGGGGAGTWYWDDRNYVLGNGWWFYQESNGISGLQRGGSSQIVPNDNEVCVDDPNVAPDMLMW